MKTFLLPDLAEGLVEAEINEWHVKVGDVIKIDQLLVSVETAKAVVEVPSPYRGKILTLYGKKGDIIGIGQPLVDFDLQAENDTDTGTVVGRVEIGHEIIQSTNLNVDSPQVAGQSYKASPAVRILAKKLGVDLSKVKATGCHQSITAQDI